MKSTCKNIYGVTSALFLFIFNNCSSLQLDKHDNFWGWMKGKPGYVNSVSLSDKPRQYTVLGERHPFYLWFRTPEIIFNPQSGVYYPDMIIKDGGKYHYTNDLSKVDKDIIRLRNLYFYMLESGFVEYIIPYRGFFDPVGDGIHSYKFCITFPFIIIFSIPLKIIDYPIHDVIKTVMIPVAGVYYTVQALEDDEEEE